MHHCAHWCACRVLMAVWLIDWESLMHRPALRARTVAQEQCLPTALEWYWTEHDVGTSPPCSKRIIWRVVGEDQGSVHDGTHQTMILPHLRIAHGPNRFDGEGFLLVLPGRYSRRARIPASSACAGLGLARPPGVRPGGFSGGGHPWGRPTMIKALVVVCVSMWAAGLGALFKTLF
jgi:hypothetical protein